MRKHNMQDFANHVMRYYLNIGDNDKVAEYERAKGAIAKAERALYIGGLDGAVFCIIENFSEYVKLINAAQQARRALCEMVLLDISEITAQAKEGGNE